MKWGIVFTSTSFPDPERAVALGQIAEETGFDSLWAPEHIIVPVEYEHQYGASDDGTLNRLGSRGGIPDPLIWLTFVASQTKTIKLGTNIMLLTERNPVHTAKEAATLDMLSKGRFLMGVGSGWCPEEYEALGVSWPNRGKRLDEYIEAVRELWTKDEASYEGEFVKFKPVQCDPKPYNGTIPIHVGGTSKAACLRAGRTGEGYFPAIFPPENIPEELPQVLSWVKEGAKNAGRKFEDIEITFGGTRKLDEVKWYADQGVHRMTIAVRGKTIPEMREDMMRFSDEVIAKSVDI